MENIIGIDMGATSIIGGRIEENNITTQYTVDTQAEVGGETTIEVLKNLISRLMTIDTTAIGVGVPSVVDRSRGIVYNVQNINNWDEVHLKKILEEEFNIPVFIDNDANCFALGEKIYGQGAQFENFVGLTLGTGVGGGIIQNNHLLKDANCGSGEFGELPYLDSIMEEYCGSYFFTRFGNMSGYETYLLAEKGDAKAIQLFEEYGKHMSALIKVILLIVDPQAIIFGGSITQSYKFFEKSMYDNLKDFPYPNSVDKLKILTSNLKNMGVLGAGSLCVGN